MLSDEPEIHPLDRDYSEDTPPASRAPIIASIDYHAKLRRLGVIVFVLGFVGLFPAAIFLNNAKGNPSAESFASLLHRLAMVVILVGGVMVFTAYRWPQISRLMNFKPGDARAMIRRPYLTLVLYNLVAFIFIVAAAALLRWVTSPAVGYLLVTGMITASFGLLVTMIVWHKGFLRAYAIGAIPALTWNTLSNFYLLNNLFLGGDAYLILVGQLAIVLLSGLACAGYVAVIEIFRSRDTQQSAINLEDSEIKARHDSGESLPVDSRPSE